MENWCGSCFLKKVKSEITERSMEAIKTGQPVFFGMTENPCDNGFPIKYNVFLTAKKANKEERFKDRQSQYLMKFEDELDIALNDLGVIVLETVIKTDDSKTLEKFNEVTKLLKEIREGLKGENK